MRTFISQIFKMEQFKIFRPFQFILIWWDIVKLKFTYMTYLVLVKPWYNVDNYIFYTFGFGQALVCLRLIITFFMFAFGQALVQG